MKHRLLLIFLFLSFWCRAQLTHCTWGFIPQGVSVLSTVHDVVKDNYGNIITVGVIYGRVDLNTSTEPQDTFFTKALAYNYYMVKTSYTGQYMWAKLFTPVGTVIFNPFKFKKIMVDQHNNVVLCTFFFGSYEFGTGGSSHVLTSHFPTYEDMSLAKYDEKGNYLWAFSVGDNQTNTLKVNTMTILPDSSIECAFYANGAVDMDPGAGVNKSVAGGTSLVYYTPAGSFISQVKLPSTYSYPIDGKTIGNDAAGNTYVISIGYYETTITKLNASRMVLWVKKMGDFSSYARVEANGIYVTPSGELYLHGTFSDTVDFDLGAGMVNKISTTQGDPDNFIAKYDSSGNLQWVNTIAGEFSFGTGFYDESRTKLYLIGNVKGSATIALSTTVTSIGAGVTSGFIAEFTPSGSCNWVSRMSDTITLKFGIRLNEYQYALVGNLRGTQDIDPTTSTMKLSSTYAGDFTAIYGAIPTGMDPIRKTYDISVYPNPVCDGTMNIYSSDAIRRLRIFSVVGKLLFEKDVEAINAINVSLALPPGVYFMEVNNAAIRRFVVGH